MKKSVPRIILSRLIGFLIFLVLLGLANYLMPQISSNFYNSIVQFFNGNIGLLLVMMFFGMLAEIFWNLFFPLDLAAPVLTAISSIFSVTFIYRIWVFIDSYLNTGTVIPMGMIYRTVFWLILVIGYIVVLARIGHGEEEKADADGRHEERLERRKEKLERKMEKADKNLKGKEIKWNDVGEEFRKVLFNVGKSINDLFEKKKK